MLICLTYVFVVKVLGPKLMQGRPPFRLQAFLVVYNAVQVVLSAYIFVQVIFIPDNVCSLKTLECCLAPYEINPN